MTQISDLSIGSKLGQYEFSSGAFLTDSSGNGRTLTNTNGVTQISNGKYGSAADFGTNNTSKQLERSEDIWGGTALSFAAWVKPHNFNDVVVPFDYHSDAGTLKQLYCYATSSTNLTLQQFKVGIEYSTVSATVSWTAGKWHHVAYTLSGAGGTGKIYFNGDEVGSQGFASGNGNVGQADFWAIGRYSSNYYDGVVDDVLYTSDVLTATEISDLAYSPPDQRGDYAFFM